MSRIERPRSVHRNPTPAGSISVECHRRATWNSLVFAFRLRRTDPAPGSVPPGLAWSLTLEPTAESDRLHERPSLGLTASMQVFSLKRGPKNCCAFSAKAQWARGPHRDHQRGLGSRPYVTPAIGSSKMASFRAARTSMHKAMAFRFWLRDKANDRTLVFSRERDTICVLIPA